MANVAFGGAEMRVAVRYRGPAPEAGRMSALEVGPAIIGLGEMVAEACRLLYGDETRVRVDVQADFEHASFGIEFYLVSIGDILRALTSDQLANLATVLGFSVGGGGLIGFLRWQRGRKIERVEPVDDDSIRITAVGGATVNVTKTEFNIYTSPRIRAAIENVARPLEREGVDSIQVSAGNQPTVTIEKGAKDDIIGAPFPEAEVGVQTVRAFLEIIAPVFRQDNKWRFAQGEAVFHAAIQDEGFMADVAKHRRTFGMGDVLEVDLEVRTTLGPRGTEYQRTIVKFHRLIEAGAGRQLPLDLSSDG